jgi:hypothetical protein
MTSSDNQLPARANAKALAIQDAALAAQAAVSATTNMIRELRDKIFHNPEREAECQSEMDRLRERLEKTQARHRALTDLSETIKRYLARLPLNASIELAPRVKARVKEGESFKKAIERIRAEIVKEKHELMRCERAELPIADRKKAARAYVNELVAKGAPQIVADHDKFAVNFLSDPYALKVNLVAMLAWFDPERLRDRLIAQIDAMPKPSFSLSKEDKKSRVREIKANIDALEREEEALIDKAEDEGFEIDRRFDASPAVVLGIVVSRERVAA